MVIEYEKNLNGQYLQAYKNIINELDIEIKDTSYIDEVKNDVLDMLLSAQTDGVEANKVIGKDIRSFCMEITSTYKKTEPLSKKILSILNSITPAIFIVAFGEMLKANSITIGISFRVMLLMVALVIPFYIAVSISRRLKITKKRKNDINIFEICAAIASAVIYVELNSVIDSSPYFYVNGIGVILINVIIQFSLKWYESKNMKNYSINTRGER